MRRILPSAVAVAVGLLVLLGYVFDGAVINSVRVALTEWAVTLAGLAVLLGVINVIRNNARRIDDRSKGWPYYALTLVALLATVVIGIAEGITNGGSALYDEASASALLIDGVVVTSQAVIAGLIVFALVFAAVRMLRDKQTGWTALFTIAVLIALLGWVPLSGLSAVNQAYQWLYDVPVTAGARGILLGVALGTIVVGIRIILGNIRPYRD
jgi:cell division protein FtsW (lipid II flippase)